MKGEYFSVDGMNFDFLAFNIIGFVYYALFNIAFYFIPEIQRQYYAIFPHGINPVRLNDVVFAVHAMAVSFITLFQCFIYKRGKQRISLTGYILVGVSFAIALITSVLCFTSLISWLLFVLCLSYQKLILTIIKYVPQLYQNYKRRSTVGWSIEQIILDFVGGVASILQMIVLAYNHDDWVHIFGDFTKFGLGLISLLFDIGFIYQHYVLYRPLRSDNPDPSIMLPKL
ncbi:unnamed protein product [Soboliphyme baturini]|uniref:Cystinosin homolog n=1 Tax=Soboliphyme baturini TaxID=241478 RepID=A0A183IDA1_9BILA|nr:unnamed protein product [Soboliphyme baturini]